MRIPCPLLLSLPPEVLATLRQLLEEEDSRGAVDHNGVGYLGHALAHLNLRKVLVPGRAGDLKVPRPRLASTRHWHAGGVKRSSVWCVYSASRASVTWLPRFS